MYESVKQLLRIKPIAPIDILKHKESKPLLTSITVYNQESDKEQMLDAKIRIKRVQRTDEINMRNLSKILRSMQYVAKMQKKEKREMVNTLLDLIKLN